VDNVDNEPIPRRMRAAHFLGDGQITIEERPVPVPGPGEALLRVHACAVCGSERELWARGAAATPGHEGAGTVVAVGPGVKVALGTRAAVYLVAYCGRCRMCRRGETGACLQKERMIGFTHDGAYADYMVAPERCLLPVDPELDLDVAIMLLDVVGTTMHAVRRARLAADEIGAACVTGVGPVGLGAVVALRALGVARVFAVDVSPYRLRLAEQLGAVPVDGRSTDVVAWIRERVADGPDVVIEASGNATAQRQAIDMVAADGRVIIVGHSRHTLDLQTSRDLIAQEKTLIGSEYFGVDEFPHNLALVRAGRLDPLPVITHRYPLSAIDDAFRLFWAGETGKVLVCP